jgi:hypothetical protein
MDQPSPKIGVRMGNQRSALVASVCVAALAPLVVVALSGMAAIDFWWDFWMGLGFASVSGLALLPVLSARWWAARHPQSALLRLIQRLHRDLAWWLTALALAHVLGVLWLEPRTLDYLLPTAPGYMAAGLVGLLLSFALIVTSLARYKRRWPQTSWRRWHAGISIAALGLMLWHVLGAGYYVSDVGARCALLWAASLPSLLALWWHYAPPGSANPSAGQGGAGQKPGLAVALAIVLGLLAAAVWLARPVGIHEHTPPVYPCPAGRCL